MPESKRLLEKLPVARNKKTPWFYRYWLQQQNRKKKEIPWVKIEGLNMPFRDTQGHLCLPFIPLLRSIFKKEGWCLGVNLNTAVLHHLLGGKESGKKRNKLGRRKKGIAFTGYIFFKIDV